MDDLSGLHYMKTIEVVAAWLTKETLHSVKWLPADEGILVKVETLIS